MATLIACPSCGGTAIPPEAYNTGRTVPCPACHARVRVDVFPAIDRPLTATTGTAVTTDEEASCFYHPSKRAETHCDACGRFLCGLCEVEIQGRHYCGSCIAAGKQKDKIEALVTQRARYDRQAWSAAIAGLLPIPYLGLLFAFAALVVLLVAAVRKNASPFSFPRWSRIVIGVLASVELVLQALFSIWVTTRG